MTKKLDELMQKISQPVVIQNNKDSPVKVIQKKQERDLQAIS